MQIAREREIGERAKVPEDQAAGRHSTKEKTQVSSHILFTKPGPMTIVGPFFFGFRLLGSVAQGRERDSVVMSPSRVLMPRCSAAVVSFQGTQLSIALQFNDT